MCRRHLQNFVQQRRKRHPAADTSQPATVAWLLWGVAPLPRLFVVVLLSSVVQTTKSPWPSVRSSRLCFCTGS